MRWPTMRQAEARDRGLAFLSTSPTDTEVRNNQLMHGNNEQRLLLHCLRSLAPQALTRSSKSGAYTFQVFVKVAYQAIEMPTFDA